MTVRKSAEATRSQHGILAWLVKRQTIEIFEAILGVAAVGLLDLFLPTQLGLQQFDLYLLWVVVLGIAARYGAPAGYVACILAGIVFEGMLFYHATPYQSISPHEAIQPFLLFVAGILVSELVRSHKRAAQEAQQKLQKANTLFHTLQEQYTNTVEVKNELERRIANQPISTGIITDFASRMNTLRTQELYPIILELLHSMLEVEASALYLLDNRQLRLAIGQPEGYAGRPGTITTNEVLAYRALRERRVVSIRDVVQQLGPNTPHTYGILAGPLLSRDGQALGVIVIEAMPLFKLTPSNIRLFEQLTLWISSALQNALVMETMLAQRARK